MVLDNQCHHSHILNRKLRSFLPFVLLKLQIGYARTPSMLSFLPIFEAVYRYIANIIMDGIKYVELI